MMDQETKEKMLKRINFHRKLNSFMLYAIDMPFALVFIATGQFVSAGIMAICALLAYDTLRKLNVQETAINEISAKSERKNKTKVEDLYPSK